MQKPLVKIEQFHNDVSHDRIGKILTILSSTVYYIIKIFQESGEFSAQMEAESQYWMALIFRPEGLKIKPVLKTGLILL